MSIILILTTTTIAPLVAFTCYIAINAESPQGCHLQAGGAEAQVLPKVLRR